VHHKNKFPALLLFSARITQAANCLPALNVLTNFMQQGLFQKLIVTQLVNKFTTFKDSLPYSQDLVEGLRRMEEALS
jgi:hypothetical protein